VPRLFGGGFLGTGLVPEPEKEPLEGRWQRAGHRGRSLVSTAEGKPEVLGKPLLKNARWKAATANYCLWPRVPEARPSYMVSSPMDST
jgi:hypothetical protein